MSAGDIAQVLTALAAIGSMVLSWRNSKKIEQVRHNTNSLAAQMLKEGKEASLAQGTAAGLKQGRDEQQ